MQAPRPALVRLAAGCGIAAPTAFVAGWLVNGLRTSGYDPLSQAISQLAREGAPTRTAMTVVFIVFGLLILPWAPVLSRGLAAPALTPVVAVAGLATLAVAAVPLSRVPGGTQDAAHALAAATGYLAMAATPLVAADALRRRGHRRAALASAVVGAVSGSCLLATVLPLDGVSGALQRTGLGVVDLWHVVAAATVLATTRAGRARR